METYAILFPLNNRAKNLKFHISRGDQDIKSVILRMETLA